VRDAFGHLKVIAYGPAATPLFDKAGIAADLDEGVIALKGKGDVATFIAAAKKQRVWAREAKVRPMP
jgi:catalase